MSNCLICNLPMGDFEKSISQKAWHDECQKCQICGESGLPANRVQKCFDEGITISHIVCWDRQKLNEIKAKQLPITRDHIKVLNESILNFRSQELNLNDVTEMSDFLREIKELAANVAFVLTLAKDKIRIKESQDYTDKVKTENKERHAREALDQERKNRLEAERKDPMLKLRRKAIEAAMSAYGMSEKDATEMIERQSKGVQ